MPKIEQKSVVVDEIKGKLKKAVSVLLVDSRGLTVDQDTILRKRLREAGVDYKVYKNTMVRLAVTDTPFEDIAPYLAGPTAVAICYDDPTIAARTINKELKGMPLLKFKAAVIENTVYDSDAVKELAQIPPRAELLSKLLGSFKAPIASFARLANALSEKRSGGGAA